MRIEGEREVAWTPKIYGFCPISPKPNSPNPDPNPIPNPIPNPKRTVTLKLTVNVTLSVINLSCLSFLSTRNCITIV